MKSFKKLMSELASLECFYELSNEELKKLQSVLLNAYLEINEVCKKHGLHLMLVGGSALGAIRHQGFIPWDDDFDCAMLRSEYEVFKKVFNKELGDRYVLNGPNCDGEPTNRFPKILIKDTRFVEIGIDENDDRAMIKLDIFIIENVPKHPLCRIVKGSYCLFLTAISSYVQFYEECNEDIKNYLMQSREGKKAYYCRLVFGWLFSFIPARQWINATDNAYQYHKVTSLVSLPSGRKHYFGEILKYKDIIPASTGIFDGHEVYLPQNPQVYLSNLYGDYMTLPPVEKREKHRIKQISFKKDEV
ncbi:MAG: LicD family protein [Clostridia bacterium]|nr:LicD family protein [Clostridia bacterium]